MCGTGIFAGFRTLAHVLLANDWVDAVAIDESREESARTGKRHGEVLVARSLLTPEQLRAALFSQHRQNLGALLALSRGSYEWRGWEPPPSRAREDYVHPVGATADGPAIPSLRARRRQAPELGRGRAPRLSGGPPQCRPRSPPGPEDAALELEEVVPQAVEPTSSGTPIRPPMAPAAVQAEPSMRPLPTPPPVATAAEPVEAPPDPQADDRARDLRRKMRERGMRNL